MEVGSGPCCHAVLRPTNGSRIHLARGNQLFLAASSYPFAPPLVSIAGLQPGQRADIHCQRGIYVDAFKYSLRSPNPHSRTSTARYSVSGYPWISQIENSKIKIGHDQVKPGMTKFLIDEQVRATARSRCIKHKPNNSSSPGIGSVPLLCIGPSQSYSTKRLVRSTVPNLPTSSGATFVGPTASDCRTRSFANAKNNDQRRPGSDLKLTFSARSSRSTSCAPFNGWSL